MIQSGSISQAGFLVGEIQGSPPQDKGSTDRKGREGMGTSFFPRICKCQDFFTKTAALENDKQCLREVVGMGL